MRAPATARWIAGSIARWTGVVGLNYHRIGDGTQSLFDRGLWSATAAGFDAQVRYLKTNFDVIAPKDVSYVVRVKRGRHVLITFDDGYADNYAAAFPILKSHRVPATFFIATGYIDRPRVPWWDEIAWMVRTSKQPSLDIPELLPSSPLVFDEPHRENAVRTLLRAYKKLPSHRTLAFLQTIADATGTGRAASGAADVEDVTRMWMTWDMLREMQRADMTIGGHTVEHPILSSMSREDQAEEISGCARRIKEELQISMRTFAYPVGSLAAFNADTRDCLRDAGVETAFSYCGGFRKLSEWDDYDIPRIAVEQETTFAEFRAAVMFPWTT